MVTDTTLPKYPLLAPTNVTPSLLLHPIPSLTVTAAIKALLPILKQNHPSSTDDQQLTTTVMKTATLLSTALFALTASASWLGSNDQVSIADTDLSVPGENPLVYCADPKDYILSIEKVDLDPNPPAAYVDIIGA